MSKKEKKIIYIVIIFFLICSICLLSVILYRHENRIKDLYKIISLMDERKVDKDINKVPYNDASYNYLAIGNSLVVHSACNYWWQQCGMAASTADSDYYHLVVEQLKKQKGDVSSAACNLAVWEQLGSDRAEALEILYPSLNNNLDLITIQLGENVKDMETFESDFKYLVQQVQIYCPKAQIIIVGDYWWNINRDTIEKKIADEFGLAYVDLSAIQGKAEYKRKLGDVVYDAEGGEHVVEHSGVAKHPNDEGMKYIADKITEKIDWDR